MTLTEQNALKRGAGQPLAACPVCDAQKSRLILDLTDVPIFCNVLSTSRAEALRAARGRLQLVFCPSCGMIYNAAFDPSRVTYSGEYENAQHFSPRFRRYLWGLALKLTADHGLYGKNIVEIGCGDGRFLSLLCAAGQNQGVGFDPAAPEQPAHSEANDISLVRELYGPDHASVPADFICCRHVLEHVADPASFLRTVRSALGDRWETTVYFEVPNVLSTLRDLGVWNLLYEHCLYFSSASLSELLVRSRFEVLDVWEAFDGQFLSMVARPAAGAPQRWDAEATRRLLADELVDRFESHFNSKVRQWAQRLESLFAQQQTIAIWGAGTKGVMFLNSVPGAERIQHVIDVNPRKHGSHVAGTGQQILSPEQLANTTLDVVIVMNPVYKEEIRAELKQAGVAASVMLV